ncbi:MAG: hypothetical protein COA37_03235 [Hoeflea sp.]|uniref:hypothetical protein n=1 Tax=Hoeflea sp. TaxID=1940281 RepID=UPI000C0D9FFE|nr:hypothetical protein [Hoeflea sp.]PHR24782.1 MAG: hypothetical protein COA37_03235 [Hoeflea sp.]
MPNATQDLARVEAAEKWLAVIGEEHEKYRARRESAEKTLVWISSGAVLYACGIIELDDIEVSGVSLNDTLFAPIVLVILMAYFWAKGYFEAQKQQLTVKEVRLCRTEISKVRTIFPDADTDTDGEWARPSKRRSCIDRFLGFHLGWVLAVIATMLLLAKFIFVIAGEQNLGGV